MVYTARVVVIGKTGKNPFAGFILASGSLPYRKMESRDKEEGEKRIYVFPRKDHEKDNITEPDVDNYACVIGKKIDKIREMPQEIGGSILQDVLLDMKKYAIVSFNGHMCKRCMENIKDGMKPEIALDSTLFEFRGLSNDARIAGMVYVDGNYEIGLLGVNDVDKMEKRIKGYKLEENVGIYTCAKNTSLETRVDIPSNASAEMLAKFISTKMIPGSEKVLAGGVCILRGGEFETGIYNTPIKDIDSWIKK